MAHDDNDKWKLNDVFLFGCDVQVEELIQASTKIKTPSDESSKPMQVRGPVSCGPLKDRQHHPSVNRAMEHRFPSSD